MEAQEYINLAERESFYFWNVGRREILREAISRRLKGAGKINILDIGCGTGGNTLLLNDFGQVTGIDLSPEALRFAKRYQFYKLIQGSATQLPFAADSFRLATALDVLEHIEDDAAAIQEAFRVLKPGGIFLVTVPAHPFLFSRHDRALHHVRRYTKTDMILKLESAGFRVLEQSHFVTLGVPINLFRKFCDKFLRGGREDKETYDAALPGFFNSLLLGTLRLENILMRFISLPVGTSLMVAVQKPYGTR